MIIDILFLVLLGLAIFKGYRRGLIVGLLSYLAFIAGLAAALKLSALVAMKIGQVIKVSDKWLPFMAFIVVFLGVVILVKWMGSLIQAGVEKIMMGWVNRLGGILLFGMIYLSAYSIFLFYINQMKILPATTIAQSSCFGFIEGFGKMAIGYLGDIIPAFKNIFEQLELFFGKVTG